jgi:hypothetical protein
MATIHALLAGTRTFCGRSLLKHPKLEAKPMSSHQVTCKTCLKSVEFWRQV